MKKIEYSDLTFDKFRELAISDKFSTHEKVGFPDAYRDGKEKAIFSDIVGKLTPILGVGKNILEIGPGCSGLPMMLADLCNRQNHQLYFIDSQEMLDQLPDYEFCTKWPGRYPSEVRHIFDTFGGKFDVIIMYSVIQYVFVEGNLWDFLDSTLSLLADGGELLIGDIPNTSMRNRFFASESGIKFHKAYTGTDDIPRVVFNKFEKGQLDDSVLISIMSRARAQGYHSWIVPQSFNLPMANRREDILIRKP